MKEIFIFDIDGCVLSQVFPNIYDNHNADKEFMSEALKKSENIALYEDFVKFYKKRCLNAQQIFFITGRQESHFGKITEKQLSPLKQTRSFDLVYYPEDKTHTAENYFNWKVEKVREIFNKIFSASKNNGNSSGELIFKIFDDMDDHFPIIKEISKKYKFKTEFVSISSAKTWRSFLN